MFPLLFPIFGCARDLLRGPERKPHNHAEKWGAGDGTRTRDSLLGKQVLYQLSYPREGRAVYDSAPVPSTPSETVQGLFILNMRG